MLRLTRSARARRPARRISASPAASRSTASPTARCCATASSRASGSSRRRAMPAARSVRRSPPITSFKGQPRKLQRPCDGMAGAYLGPELRAGRDRAAAARRPAPRFTVLDDDATDRARRRRRWPTSKAVGWFQGRMEFGPRALGAPLDPRRSALARHAEDAQPQGQVPRELPAVRARRCCARTSPTGSSSTPTAPTCCWCADVREDRRRAMTRGGAGAVRHRQAQRRRARTSRP